MILLRVALKRNSVFSKVGSLCGFGVCLFLFKKIAHIAVVWLCVRCEAMPYKCNLAAAGVFGSLS